LNVTREAVRFHAAGGIDRISPEVVDKVFDTNYTSNNGAGVDADADAEVIAALLMEMSDRLLHIECEESERFCKIALRG